MFTPSFHLGNAAIHDHLDFYCDSFMIKGRNALNG